MARAIERPKEAQEKATQELKRLEMMPPMSAESTVSRNYLEWLLAVPWKKKSREVRDLAHAEQVLAEDHYGLEKIKERILEYLAVRSLVKEPKGQILCFVGPPGVGKTSLGMSIARATGRQFVRLSLGGVRDEAEIRGHRRTYIGALPGQIIQMMKKSGTKNPVFMLDEVEKMSMDFRGDPSAALLEVLDPEQNHMFMDHYLDVEYDLSQVFFICTANVVHTIPPALLDRMEVLRLSGYTELEKMEIAKRFLVKKQMKAAGLKDENLRFSDEVLSAVIQNYTREAGVRNLEREIANICRKVARKVVKEGRSFQVVVTPENLADYLGILKFRDTLAEKTSEIGLAIGLAWTEVGGQILATEATLMDGKGRLTLTGKLGDVMQESAQAAMSYVRSRSHLLGLNRDFYRRMDIHVHVPEGAIPKDGPSAGITILDAIRGAEEGAGNAVIREGLLLAAQEIADGKNVTAAFQDVGLFPPLVIRMLKVGESTGALDTALLNVSYFYNREVREGIAKIQVLIEPALTVVLGLILGWVMLSVLGPIYDVISKIKI